ncbi:MAG: hypothetical protein H6686_00585 [Fibrobacteria bacterium]|nr:hypothetical protein [Fibrobacteria bacterium]
MTFTTLILPLAFHSAMVFGSGFPKDSTDSWCSMLPAEYHVYKCLPNPWGSGSVSQFYRFPDTSLIQGCLTDGFGERFEPDAWVNAGGGPPYLPRLSLDQDKFCLDGWMGLVVNRANPGDSIDIEFKMIPSDTVASDTIRGWFKAYYRGEIIDPGYVKTSRKSISKSFRHTNSGIIVPRIWQGPYRLLDLKGRTLPLRTSHEGDQIRLLPATVLPPGLYRLVWPGGSTGFLVPSKPR